MIALYDLCTSEHLPVEALTGKVQYCAALHARPVEKQPARAKCARLGLRPKATPNPRASATGHRSLRNFWSTDHTILLTTLDMTSSISLVIHAEPFGVRLPSFKGRARPVARRPSVRFSAL